MNNLLKLALSERDELRIRLENINKVIVLLGGDATSPTRRRHNEETRKKMKDAWSKRKGIKSEPPVEETIVAHDE